LALRPQSENAQAVAIAANAPAKTAPTPAPKAASKPITLASAAPIAIPAPKPAAKPIAKPAKAKKAPIVETAGVAPSRIAKPTPAAKPAPAARQRVAKGQYILQLGAFSSQQGAQKAWSQLTAQYRELAPFGNASSTVKSNGRTLYRLAATGFGNEQSAKALCDGIKARGGSCIVRKSGNGSAGSARLAARR
jgi:hypothetical protein